jgi:GDPmannose 4,6-dehydratase
MQWLMLQQRQAEDFVIATGQQASVRDFVRLAAERLGIRLRFEGAGAHEVGIVETTAPGPGSQGETARLAPGQVVVRVDPRYFRPTEVETLLGDATKAREKLGWSPRTTLAELVAEMADSDFTAARRDALVKSAGFQAYDYHE